MSETLDDENGLVEQAAIGGVVRGERGRYAPGHSGNPTGQKRGFASRARKALQKILDEPATADKDGPTKMDEFWRTVYTQSVKKGDMVAARLIAERILPAAFEADISMSGMGAGEVVDIIGCLGEDYARDGRLPAVPDDGT